MDTEQYEVRSSYSIITQKCVCARVTIKNCGFLHTRQFLCQVDVAVLLGEMHPFIARAQQTPAGENGYCSV